MKEANYTEILEAKIAHYGNTEAAHELDSEDNYNRVKDYYCKKHLNKQ